MDILYTETHAHTLRHRHARTLTHALCTHRHAYNSCAHTRVWHCVFFFFTVCLPYTRSHSQIYTNTLYKSMCTQTPTCSLLNSLFLTLTRPRAHSHTLLHVNIVDKPSSNLSLHILLWPFFGRQTMRNDSKWKCTTCSPIRPLSSKPNICVSLSVCTRLVVRSAEKKKKRLQPMKNVRELLKAPSLVS